jgi:hypothetical protein
VSGPKLRSNIGIGLSDKERRKMLRRVLAENAEIGRDKARLRAKRAVKIAKAARG